MTKTTTNHRTSHPSPSTCAVFFLFFALMATLPLGCGGEESSGTAQQEPDGRYACEAMVEAICSRITCTMQPQSQCQETAEKRGVCDEQVMKDGSKLDECLDFIELATCDQIDDLTGSVCEEVLR